LTGAAGPIWMRCVAIPTWRASRSASEYTATDSRPMRFSVRMMRQAISPRFAISTRRTSVDDDDANGSGVERVARVVDLGAIRDDRENVHVGSEIYREPGAGNAVDDPECA